MDFGPSHLDYGKHGGSYNEVGGSDHRLTLPNSKFLGTPLGRDGMGVFASEGLYWGSHKFFPYKSQTNVPHAITVLSGKGCANAAVVH